MVASKDPKPRSGFRLGSEFGGVEFPSKSSELCMVEDYLKACRNPFSDRWLMGAVANSDDKRTQCHKHNIQAS